MAFTWCGRGSVHLGGRGGLHMVGEGWCSPGGGGVALHLVGGGMVFTWGGRGGPSPGGGRVVFTWWVIVVLKPVEVNWFPVTYIFTDLVNKLNSSIADQTIGR